uniref:Minor capsid component n=1 Tax=Myoviridae sp. ctRci5 TaxID=2825105 RepID=A0A8S5V6D3_9CAUD|nr:MAG TPA: minor capsid component [Myoviridae sp. ctRci5]
MNYPDAADYLRARGVEPAAEFYARLEHLRKEAWTLAKISDVEQIEQVKQSLIQALQEGKSFREWQQALTPEMLALPKHYQETVFRTAVLSSYNGAKWTHFRAHAERRPVLRYIAINDSRTRPAHRALHGLMMPVEDARWANLAPPLGFNCRCSLVSLSDKQAKALGYTGTPQELPTWEDDHGVQHTATADKGWSSPERRDLTDYLRQKEAKAGLGRAVYDEGKPVPKPEPYLPPPPTDTASAARHHVVTHGQADGLEHGYLVDKDGRLIDTRSGKADSIDYTDILGLLAGATLYHNHPSATSLSAADIYLMADNGVAELVAYGTHEAAEYRAQTLVRAEIVKATLYDVDIAVKRFLSTAYKQGKMSKDEAIALRPHLTNTALDKMGVIKYSPVQMSHATQAAVRAHETMIQEWLEQIK